MTMTFKPNFMKGIIFLTFLFLTSFVSAQKVELVSYEQLNNPKKAKFLSKKIKFEAVEMPDGTIFKVGDTLKFGKRYGEKRRVFKSIQEDTYSTLKYGGSFSAAPSLFDVSDDHDPQYMYYVEKGKAAVIHKFKPQKKLDGTFFVSVILKPLDDVKLIGNWNRARASIESFENGELIKIN